MNELNHRGTEARRKIKYPYHSARVVLARLAFIVAMIRVRHRSGLSLAMEYEVSARTIVRDIDFLRDMGVDISTNYQLGYKLGPCGCRKCGRLLI